MLRYGRNQHSKMKLMLVMSLSLCGVLEYSIRRSKSPEPEVKRLLMGVREMPTHHALRIRYVGLTHVHDAESGAAAVLSTTQVGC